MDADIYTMTKAQLLEYCAAHGIAVNSSSTKAVIIEAIEASK